MSDAQDPRYRDALASILDSVVVVDDRGQVVSANDRAADLVKVGVEDIRKLNLAQIAGLFRNKVRDPADFEQQVLAMGKTAPLATELVFPLAGSAGNLRVYCLPVVAVESPTPAEGERSEEEELEHLKKEFISTVSHELRTPLTAIKGAIGLALGGAAGPVNPQLRELLELAEKNTDRLIALINDILDMFRLESRRLQMRMDPISMEDSIQHEISRNWAVAEKARITLVAEIERDLPPAQGDRVRIEQAIEHLLSNAIKFSPAGGVVTICAKKAVEDGARFVQVSVQDHGKGISLEAQKRIFSKFAQAEDTLTREHQGSGLGLAIARAIIDHHRGRIWFESTPGKGSTFYFTVPMAATPAQRAGFGAAFQLSEEEKHKPLVLVVDDDSDVARVVCGIFSAQGYRAWPVDRGQEAVEMAERHQPALIALDLFMPGMSGYEVLHLLKQNSHTRSIPVIVMSVVDDSNRALSLGAERFVSKPIDAPALVEIARSVLGRQAPEGSGGRPSGTPAP